jgi:hypothetical protein
MNNKKKSLMALPAVTLLALPALGGNRFAKRQRQLKQLRQRSAVQLGQRIRERLSNSKREAGSTGHPAHHSE